MVSASCTPEGKAYDLPCHRICLRCACSGSQDVSARCGSSLRTMNSRYDKRVARGSSSMPDRQVLSARVQIPTQFVDFTSRACDDLPSPSKSVGGCAPGAGVDFRSRRRPSRPAANDRLIAPCSRQLCPHDRVVTPGSCDIPIRDHCRPPLCSRVRHVAAHLERAFSGRCKTRRELMTEEFH